jgi:hypothetical protein
MGIEHVLISAIPPRDQDPTISDEFNAQLQAYATSQGWSWVDPWVPSRHEATRTWLPGLTAEGFHPVVSAAESAALSSKKPSRLQLRLPSRAA